MAEKKQKDNNDQSLLERLKKKDRLVVVDLETYEEIRHFNFSVLNIIIYALFITLIIISLTWTLIAYTPIRQAIPGYPNISKQKKLAYIDKQNLAWIEEKKEKLNREHLYYRNLSIILSDSIVMDSINAITETDSANYTNQDFSISKKDSLLRQKIENQEKYLINTQQKGKGYNDDLKGVLFFPPINGTITDSINTKKRTCKIYTCWNRNLYRLDTRQWQCYSYTTQ